MNVYYYYVMSLYICTFVPLRSTVRKIGFIISVGEKNQLFSNM